MSPIDRRVFYHVNWRLAGLLAVLFAIGVLNLYSASGVRLGDGMQVENYYQKQLIWGSIGLSGMVAFMVFDYRRLNAVAWPLYVMTLLLLLAVPIIGKTVLGARRWLDFGLFNFQPSELAKFSVLLIGARLLSSDSERLNLRELAAVIGLGLVPALLIIKQPDLGTGLLVLMLLAGLVLYRGVQPWLFRTLCVLIPLITPAFWFVLKDYQKRRILAFLDPATDPLGSGYHILQSEIAVGSGRLFGKGFLGGTQSQLRFLPEKHTDFAVAVYGEEWGFFGMIVLLSLFCAFLYQVAVVARDAKDPYGSYLAAGVFFYFFWQILINMGMVMGLMPVVGVPLPFISYGGSATLVNFSLVGLVLNISMRRYLFKQT
ncbi:MAG: rod shape-determining protein RodA [Humidesulfovibrio sp.]|jgi:rod shape determining protein RodA|uniref:rod shape-determining protein RodA n=1 Tax=Humidesulfovibrio sp. TaxID=2910988 RepID=UPI002736AEB9|nr:rod shape-determining protein RodA [Humidesulfovibrio sp.]MDP2849001.1 rod shape-determining protein RodA [Humidesulfovibrio sp.]